MKELRYVLMMTTYCLVGIVLVAQAKVCSLNEIEIFVDIVQQVLSSGFCLQMNTIICVYLNSSSIDTGVDR